MSATTVDELQVLITANTAQLQKEISKTQSTLSSLQKSSDKMGKGIVSGFKWIKTGITALGIGALIKKITGDMGDAVKRLDALNNFPRVMSNLGISNEDAQASIDLLSEKLKGLPTTLDDASLAVQRFTSANGNVKASTVMFLGLNDAILAGGASSEIQKSALEQLSQAYAKGKPDMMEWRTAMMAMPAQLKQVALAMGYVSADQLGEALRSGKVSMNEFMSTIARLDKEGANGFASFRDQAMNSAGGVATSMTNVKTAITRGLADIMNEIGQSNIAGFFQGVAKAIGTVTNYVVAFVRVIVTAVRAITGLFGKKTNSAINGTASSTDNASSSMSNLGASGGSASKGLDKASGSAKKLKKELNGLASFDEMNVLKEASDSGSGGSGGSGGVGGVGGLGDFDLSMFDELDKGVSDVDKIYDRIMNIAQVIGNIAGQGFKLSFGDTNFDGILNHINGIKESLISIGTDPNITNAIQNWSNTVLFNLGRMVGAVARYGTNIVEAFVGSIDNYLSQNLQRIQNAIVNIFSISSDIWNMKGNLYQALGEISDVLKGDTAKQIGADMIAVFVNPIMSITQLVMKFSRDFANIFIQPIVDNVGKIKVAFENTFSGIQIITGTFSEALTYVGDKINEVYDNHVSPFLQSFATGISDTFGKFLDVYNQYVAPVLQNMATQFSELWNTHLKPFVDEFAGLVGSIWDALTAFWNGVLKPLVDWLIQNVIPAVVPVLEKIWNVVIKVVGGIIDYVKNIMAVLKEVITFLTAVFSGDWDKAWESVKNIFNNIWTGITDNLKNWCDLMNSLIELAIEALKQSIILRFNAIKDFISTNLNNIKNSWDSAWNALKTGATNAWNGVKNVFSNVATYFGNIFSNAWNKVKSIFSTGGAVFTGITEGIVSQFKRIVNGIIGGINRVVATPFNAINTALNRLRSINIAGMTPFSGIISRINVPQIPQLARGGVVDRATIAMIGEQGKEAVVPLENNTSWIDKISDQIAQSIGNDGQPIQLTVKIGEDTIFDRFIENIKEKNFETNGEAFSI